MHTSCLRHAIFAGLIAGAAASVEPVSAQTSGPDQTAKLLAKDGAMANIYCGSVSVSGDTALIGTPYDRSVNGGNSGSAHVFRFDGADWTQQAKLLADDGAWGDEFGFSISVSGDTAVIGARLDGDSDKKDKSARRMCSVSTGRIGCRRPNYSQPTRAAGSADLSRSLAIPL